MPSALSRQRWLADSALSRQRWLADSTCYRKKIIDILP